MPEDAVSNIIEKKAENDCKKREIYDNIKAY